MLTSQLRRAAGRQSAGRPAARRAMRIDRFDAVAAAIVVADVPCDAYFTAPVADLSASGVFDGSFRPRVTGAVVAQLSVVVFVAVSCMAMPRD